MVAKENEQTQNRHVNNRFYNLKDMAEEAERLERNYILDTRSGKRDYTEELKELYESDDYKVLQVFDHPYYKNELEKAFSRIKLAQEDQDKAEIDAATQNLIQLERELIADVEEILGKQE